MKGLGACGPIRQRNYRTPGLVTSDPLAVTQVAPGNFARYRRSYLGTRSEYTRIMHRRLITLLVVLAMGLQGPIQAHAAASAGAQPTMSAAADCCPAHAFERAGRGCSHCPAVMLHGDCSAGCVVITAILNSGLSLPAASAQLVPWESGTTPFATESLTPQLRPPIV
jgi:hypothetical protein